MDEKAEAKSVQCVLDDVKKKGVMFVNLQFTDLFGTLKSVTIPTAQLEESFEKGTWFDGSSIEGFARIHESDMFLKPDASTYAVIPWTRDSKATARLICDVYDPKGKAFESDPRYILKKTVEEAKKEGFIFNTGPELEFYLFKVENGNITHVPHDVGGYFDYSAKDLASEIRKDIILSMKNFGIDVEMAHHEVGPGQHEIDFRYADALTTADRAITLKSVVKSVAQAEGVYASFMPKPLYGKPGNGMHVHQSLFDLSGKNTFFDESNKYKLSKTALGFIAGQLKHAKAISAVVAPTVNSYKRLVSGFEAPVYLTWAQINRSALLRVPCFSKGREQSTRVELRCPDPSANPYLAFAVMLKAGLDGVRHKMQPSEPVEEDVYGFDNKKLSELNIARLPGSLNEALVECMNNSIVKETFGDATFKKYIEAKQKEWSEYRTQVSAWEIEQYFETL